MQQRTTHWRDQLLMQMFGRPQGLLGRIGGVILAQEKRDFFPWVIEQLAAQPGDQVLEVGFGPGVAISHLVKQAVAAHIAGVDYSEVMLQQASRRNAAAIAAGKVELRYGSALALPFADETFTCAFSINSMQLWPDAAAGLRELARVLKPGGRLALGFTAHAGQAAEPLPALVTAAGFAQAHLIHHPHGIGLVAIQGSVFSQD